MVGRLTLISLQAEHPGLALQVHDAFRRGFAKTSQIFQLCKTFAVVARFYELGSNAPFPKSTPWPKPINGLSHLFSSQFLHKLDTYETFFYYLSIYSNFYHTKHKLKDSDEQILCIKIKIL